MEQSSLTRLQEMLESGDYHNVIVMAGAGISVAAGIPDFRSPTIGLYSSLKEMTNLRFRSPTFVFSIDVFMEDPRPFWWIFCRLWPRSDWPEPTSMHHLFKNLNDRGILRRVYTQNVDGLEEKAGLERNKIVYSHGVLDPCHCLDCGEKISLSYCLEQIQENINNSLDDYQNVVVPKCPSCGKDHVKPDVTFFGESLPNDFFLLREEDFDNCDLLIITGTSLEVHPFAGLVNWVKPEVPRFLINMNKVKEIGGALKKSWNWVKSAALLFMVDFSGVFDFESDRDFFIGGDCQDTANHLINNLKELE